MDEAQSFFSSKLSFGNTKRKTGENKVSYKLQRLRRERKDLLEKVLNNEISANAAYIEAGFAERKMSVPLNPDKVVNWINKYFTPEDIQHIKELL